MVVRGKRRKGTRYFGPYAHAYAIRQTLDLMLRTFPIRTCTDAKFRRHETIGRPCLLFHIEKCAGPCVGEIDADRYQDLVDGHGLVLRRGRPLQSTERLTAEMHGGGRRSTAVRTGRADSRPAERGRECNGAPGAGHRAAGRLRRGCGGRRRVGGGARRAPRATWPDHRPQGHGGRPSRGRRHPVADRHLADRAVRIGASPARGARPGTAGRCRCAGRHGSPSDGEVRCRCVCRSRGEAEGPRDRCGQRRRGVQPAPPEAAHRPQRSGACPERHPVDVAASGSAASDRVLRHLDDPGNQHGRVDGRLRGRSSRRRATTADSRSEP